MAKAKIVRDKDGLFYGLRINCPGCVYSDGSPQGHIMPVQWLPEGETQESPYNEGKPHWTFNGDLDKPVFGPSLLTWWGGEGTNVPLHRCHSFIGCNGAEPGQIIFLGDSTHKLANQTVELPEFDERENQDD